MERALFCQNSISKSILQIQNVQKVQGFNLNTENSD